MYSCIIPMPNNNLYEPVYIFDSFKSFYEYMEWKTRGMISIDIPMELSANSYENIDMENFDNDMPDIPDIPDITIKRKLENGIDIEHKRIRLSASSRKLDRCRDLSMLSS